MKEFTVSLNALASVSYKVKASTAKEAYEIVSNKIASLSDCEVYDWLHDQPGEVINDVGFVVDITELDELGEQD